MNLHTLLFSLVLVQNSAFQWHHNQNVRRLESQKPQKEISSLNQNQKKSSLANFKITQDKVFFNGVPLTAQENQVFYKIYNQQDQEYWNDHSEQFYTRYKRALKKYRKFELEESQTYQYDLYEYPDSVLYTQDDKLIVDGKIVQHELYDWACQVLLESKSEAYWNSHSFEKNNQLGIIIRQFRQELPVQRVTNFTYKINKYKDVFINGEQIGYHETQIFYQLFETKNSTYWRLNQNELVELLLKKLEEYENNIDQQSRFITKIYYLGQQLTRDETVLYYQLRNSLDIEVSDKLFRIIFEQELRHQKIDLEGPFSNDENLTREGLVLVQYFDGVRLTGVEQLLLKQLENTYLFQMAEEEEQANMFLEQVAKAKMMKQPVLNEGYKSGEKTTEDRQQILKIKEPEQLNETELSEEEDQIMDEEQILEEEQIMEEDYIVEDEQVIQEEQQIEDEFQDEETLMEEVEKVGEIGETSETRVSQFRQRGEKHEMKKDEYKNVYLDGVKLTKSDMNLFEQIYKSKGQAYWKQNLNELCDTFIELKGKQESSQTKKMNSQDIASAQRKKHQDQIFTEQEWQQAKTQLNEQYQERKQGNQSERHMDLSHVVNQKKMEQPQQSLAAESQKVQIKKNNVQSSQKSQPRRS